jgi:hypothetical protein
MILLVTGGRKLSDQLLVHRELDIIHAETHIDLLGHGDAAGADRLADDWARSHGVQRAKMPANWDYFEPDIAGPRRNRLMLLIKPDLLLAFPGGTGTASMVRLAKDAGVPVKFAAGIVTS